MIFVTSVLGFLFAGAILIGQAGFDEFKRDLFSWLLPAILLLLPFIMAVRGNMLVVLSRESLKVQVGFLPFAGRTVALRDIASVEKTYLPWYKAKTQKGALTKQERYAITWGDALLIHPKEGKPFIFQTQNREEIARVLKNLLPDLQIS